MTLHAPYSRPPDTEWQMMASRSALSSGFAAVLALGCFVFAGCDCGGAPEGVVDRCQSELSLPPSVSTDILFVIDNSRSMREEQDKVLAQLRTFVESLVSGPVENDFQIGVVTTGISQYVTTCDGQGPNDLLEFPGESGLLQHGRLAAGELPLLSSRDLKTGREAWLAKVSLLLDQGVDGSGQEQGLEAARRALSSPLIDASPTGNPPGNQGLLRAGSRLLVIVLSDEDDCSVPAPEALAIEPACGGGCAEDSDCGGQGNYCVLRTAGDPGAGRICVRNVCETPEGRQQLVPVQSYVDFFEGLDDGTGRGRQREVFLAVIGAVDESLAPARCRSAGDEAYGIATRYAEAVAAMGDRGLIDSICKADYGATLQGIASLVGAPHTLDLPQDPLDGHLVQLQLTRAAGQTRLCKLGDGFSFEPASGSNPARVTLEGDCRLQGGDQIELKLVCAG